MALTAPTRRRLVPLPPRAQPTPALPPAAAELRTVLPPRTALLLPPRNSARAFLLRARARSFPTAALPAPPPASRLATPRRASRRTSSSGTRASLRRTPAPPAARPTAKAQARAAVRVAPGPGPAWLGRRGA